MVKNFRRSVSYLVPNCPEGLDYLRLADKRNDYFSIHSKKVARGVFLVPLRLANSL